MIGVVDVAVQAANVSMPLFPWRAFRNSYSSVRVRNVPRKIGKWNITNVTVQVTYPDGSIKTADAVLTGGVWVATLEGTATAGTSLQGYKILASGIDENGQPVSNYCLGRGDVTILEDDGELIPENVITYTRLLSAEPSTPKDGDLWQLSGKWYIYQDGTSYPIGDDSGLIQQLTERVDDIETTLSDKADISSTVLNPTYSQTPTFSEWAVEPPTYEGERLVPVYGAESYSSGWSLCKAIDLDVSILTPIDGDKNATYLRWDEGEQLVFTASRTRTDIIGYKLGNQNDKPLQPQLSDAQISAIDSIVDERATIFDFGNGDISALNLVGEITVRKLIDAGIHNEDDTWIKDPVSVKLGTAVTGIDAYTFFTAMYMTNITFPNSVTHIDNSAFEECRALSSITIPESVESVGAYAFNACYNLTSIIVKGKTQAEAETMFAGAGVSPSIITTWNDASQEWVADNYATNIYANAISALAQSASDKANQIDDKIPAQTWNTGNELADKAFVNSSVQTATANFRGNWSTWADVPSISSDYPEDYAGSKVPTVNDYLVVQDASDLSSTYEGTWRFKYIGTWATEGKNGWLPEYQVNETPMTAAQLAALNSGITAQKVLSIDLIADKADISAIPTSADYVALIPNSKDNVKNAVTIGTRKAGSYVGERSFVFGLACEASGPDTLAFGWDTSAVGKWGACFSIGENNISEGECSFALGSYAEASDDFAFTWNHTYSGTKYPSHGEGTFNINPKNGLSGFYIGNTSLASIIGDIETIVNAI